ncbi:MAG TPA: hypothetical protein VF593_05620 [Chthoniobacteraceae bacterium]|jgi:hypothetical protein
MKRAAFSIWLICSSVWALAAAEDQGSALVVVGVGGEDEYAAEFAGSAQSWSKGCAAGGVKALAIGVEAAEKDSLARLRAALEKEPKDAATPLWLVLFGHGTFGGGEGKFNLRGNDLAAGELAAWLKPFTRPVIVVCGFSASGAFLKPLVGPNRVIITATRSGAENNYSRFGGYFAEAVASAKADLDQDGQTSVLEAWLSAAQRVNEFYAGEGRLATEHSLLEDNGDGLGTPADWFKGVRAERRSKDGRAPDGLRAHQIQLVPSKAERLLPPAVRQERDALELELGRLREAKGTMPEEEYLGKIEPVLRRIAQLYQKAAEETR